MNEEMVKILTPNEPIDWHEFAPGNNNPKVKYGLPQDVKFCKSCVTSNQRPSTAEEYSHNRDTKKETIFFDENCICDACKVKDSKKSEIDWEERESKLIELCNQHRRDDGQYDCIATGSGGKDSFYASHMLKYKYGMHPLTVTWAPHIYTDWGWKNMQAWIHAGFDNETFTANGKVLRLLTRIALENLFHPFQLFINGYKTIAGKASVRHKIPLVFYGESEAEYGNASVDHEIAVRNWRYFAAEDQSKVLMGGVPITELKKNFGLDQHDLMPFMPSDPDAMSEIGTEIHYLGHYLKWHPQSNYYFAVEHGGFNACPERNPGTYSKYNGLDDKMDDLHFYTTFIKFGIGRATYDAAQETRSGDITREEGVALVNRYDGEFPERFADELFRYLSITEDEFPQASHMFASPIIDRDYFSDLTDQFRSPHLWKHENGQWSLRHTVL